MHEPTFIWLDVHHSLGDSKIQRTTKLSQCNYSGSRALRLIRIHLDNPFIHDLLGLFFVSYGKYICNCGITFRIVCNFGFLSTISIQLIVLNDSLVVTWILWLAVAASMTTALGGSLDCSSETFFLYCGQLNAIEAFAWLMWYAMSLYTLSLELTSCGLRILITLTLIVVLIRGIKSSEYGFNSKMVV